MVRARLNIICGNCGESEDLEFRPDTKNGEDESTIVCNNCGTLHFLKRHFENEKYKRDCFRVGEIMRGLPARSGVFKSVKGEFVKYEYVKLVYATKPVKNGNLLDLLEEN